MTEEQLSLEDAASSRDIPHARSEDAWTSHAAARSTEQSEGPTSLIRPQSTKHIALEALASHPRTAIEVERATGRRGIWKRVSDLKNAALIESVGSRRDAGTGREGLVWAVTEKGATALAMLDRGEAVRV